MGFERYERSDGPTAAEPRVSLRASGSVGLNSAAVDAYFEGVEGAVLYYDPEGERIGIEPAAFDDHAGERPARIAVVDVDPPAEAASTTARGDGVTVSVVPEAGDLTGIGIPLADHGTRLRDDSGTLVVCFDSVSNLLDGATVEEVTEFLGVVTAKVREWGTTSTDVRAHYHLDADGHRPETVDAVTDHVDVSVSLDGEGEVSGIRR